MADTTLTFNCVNDGTAIPLKVADNGDSTYSLSIKQTGSYYNGTNSVRGRATAVDTTAVTAITGTTLTYIYATDLVIANFGTVDATINLRSGTDTATMMTYPAPANKRGVVHAMKTPFKCAIGTPLVVVADISPCSIVASVIGYTATS